MEARNFMTKGAFNTKESLLTRRKYWLVVFGTLHFVAQGLGH
jgi:hypothetical protein